MELSKYKLIIFDLDGTLSKFATNELLPGVKEWFDSQTEHILFGLASNQGGVGLRYWMEQESFGEPEKYPTERQVWQQVNDVIRACGFHEPGEWARRVCYRYLAKSGNWSPAPNEALEWSKEWRKPKPGMILSIMEDYRAYYDIHGDNTLFVGDWGEDLQAAVAAAVDFKFADEFFGRK